MTGRAFKSIVLLFPVHPIYSMVNAMGPQGFEFEICFRDLVLALTTITLPISDG